MGAVDTTYTFTATDTITSSKMNNIIDQTTITTDAIIGTTLDVASGKLKIRSAGITSNEMGSNSVVTAAITDSNVTTAKIADANVTQTKLAPNVAGNGPLIFTGSNTVTAVPTGFSATKITLDSKQIDTNNNFANSRFTPTLAGYYQINVTVETGAGAKALCALIRKNGAAILNGTTAEILTFASSSSMILYCNGSTDYIELFATHTQGSTVSLTGSMNACLIRSA